jgi:hypothetical protein
MEKKEASVTASSASATRSRGEGGGGGAVWSARRGQQALEPCCLGIHRVHKIKMKQSHCIKDKAGFTEGGDAGGQAGGKARSTEAYRLHRGHLFSKKTLHQRIG